MPRAAPLYVRQLFVLLQELGISRRQVAEALGFTKQAISNWATGAMSVPVVHRHKLLQFVETSMEEALEAAAQAPPLPPRPGPRLVRLPPIPRVDILRWRLGELLTDWASECLQQRGALDHDYHQAVEILLQYRAQPLSALSAEERDRVHGAVLRCLRAVRTTRCVQEGWTEAEASLLELGPEASTLQERLWQIAAWATAQEMGSAEKAEDEGDMEG